MLIIQQSNRFEKDVKLCKKRGFKMVLLKETMKLVATDSLTHRHRPHILSGDYTHYWECHIKSDWLLIYRKDGNTITFERTGTHSDLFK